MNTLLSQKSVSHQTSPMVANRPTWDLGRREQTSMRSHIINECAVDATIVVFSTRQEETEDSARGKKRRWGKSGHGNRS